MKRIFIIVLLVLSLVAVHAQSYDSAGALDISMVNQDPDPVEPGHYVDVRWKVENLGTKALENVEVELMPSYPFSIDPGDSAHKDIRTLDSLQNGDTGVIIKYKVRVDENALEGNNTLKLRYRTADTGWLTQEYSIDVQSIDANIGIESIETAPSVILPGKTFDLKIRLKNLADSVMKDVSIKLDLMLSSISAGTATSTTKSEILDALPFAPINSATEKKVRNIKPGDEVIFSYSLIAYPDADSKVYKIPIELNFYDSLGNEYTQNDVIGVVVTAQPDITAVLQENTFTGKDSKGTVTVKFVNKGLTNIKFLNVHLGKSDDYTILSPDEVYIGNIDSDDYETADFDLLLKTNKSDIPLPIHYDYMDSDNDVISQDKVLSINLDEGTGASGSNTTVIVIVAAALAVIIFLIILAARKRRKH